ncbi:NAD-dependent epimerase/dehydratase family protein [Gracilibacillus sp. HCP3S3_G5_1]|uniref:NAD-dependent epimerase/dehydratase family protein n=1 Tax=unclassified Gracilibacillus TaxID=2625209 RepID=UPI003F888261
MRILIIGGTKFIGPHVVRLLLEEEHELTLFHRGKTSMNLSGSIQHIYGDRDELDRHSNILQKIKADVVLDMIPYSEKDAQTVMKVFSGFAGRVIAISSADVYRAYEILHRIKDGPVQEIPLKEIDELRSTFYPYRGKIEEDFAYDYEKILVEKTVLNDINLPGTVLRLPMVYGPNDPQRRMFEYIQKMKDERPYILLDEQLAHWKTSMGYVENVASAIAMTVLKKDTASHVLNIGEKEPLSMLERVKEIGKAMNWKGQVITIPKGYLQNEIPFDTQQDLVLDTTKIREQFNYKEAISRDEEVKRTIQWELNNLPIKSPFDYSQEDKLIQALNLGNGIGL